MKEAKSQAKPPICFYCHKPTTSFCNSHSIPKFCLKHVSCGDQLYTLNRAVGLKFLDDEKGMEAAGTFRIICADCDNTIFRLYENPRSYENTPNDQMLAQIALKNYLQLISRRLVEIQLYELQKSRHTKNPARIEAIQKTKNTDLHDYIEGFNRARQGGIKDRGDWYYLCSFHKLDYTIPFAAQAAITLVVDFDGHVINNIFSPDPKSKTTEIHVLALPLGNNSVVMTFIDSRDTRYKSFYKKLRTLSIDDALATINFIIFAYTENVFISKQLDSSIFNSVSFKQVCGVGVDPQAGWSGELLAQAIRDYDLSKRHIIPNLLSEKYSINYEA